MSLVNNQATPSRMNVQPSGGFKATFSKATGRFRKTSNATLQPLPLTEDPFLSSPAPQLSRTTTPLTQVSTNNLYSSGSTAAPSVSPPIQLGGPRAQKKRISVDMVGAPRVDSFVHAAHASDAEQAEQILMRWSRDGVGKIAGEWMRR